jgi:hypothetical protein
MYRSKQGREQRSGAAARNACLLLLSLTMNRCPTNLRGLLYTSIGSAL